MHLMIYQLSGFKNDTDYKILAEQDLPVHHFVTSEFLTIFIPLYGRFVKPGMCLVF